jgi:hypothetical protein
MKTVSLAGNPKVRYVTVKADAFEYKLAGKIICLMIYWRDE